MEPRGCILNSIYRYSKLVDDGDFQGVGELFRDGEYVIPSLAFLHRERDQLFPDEAFADLFEEKGRRSVPPSVVAVVMVLQRLEGLSDREAAERYCFDNRWRYAAGVGGYDSAGWTGFAHTVLVDMRERLRRSEQPNRIFDAARDAAKEAGLIGRKRVLDSTPLYDAVATMDTVTLIRSAIRGLLKVADAELAAELRAALSSGDDYATSAKPMIDWDDEAAREALIDSRAKDAYACLLVLERQRTRSSRHPGRQLARHRRRPGHRSWGRRHLAHRPQGDQGPGDLDRRSRGPPRAQNPGQKLRRLQGPRRHRPRLLETRRSSRSMRRRPSWLMSSTTPSATKNSANLERLQVEKGRLWSSGRDISRRSGRVKVGGRPPEYLGAEESDPSSLKLCRTALTRSGEVKATLAIWATSPLGREQHHLGPAPSHHRARRAPHDLEQASALVVADVSNAYPFAHVTSISAEANSPRQRSKWWTRPSCVACWSTSLGFPARKDLSERRSSYTLSSSLERDWRKGVLYEDPD